MSLSVVLFILLGCIENILESDGVNWSLQVWFLILYFPDINKY